MSERAIDSLRDSLIAQLLQPLDSCADLVCLAILFGSAATRFATARDVDVLLVARPTLSASEWFHLVRWKIAHISPPLLVCGRPLHLTLMNWNEWTFSSELARRIRSGPHFDIQIGRRALRVPAGGTIP
jgi:hypothetical protein